MIDSRIIDEVITDILKTEGWPEYTDLPEDRGGPTKGGVTLQTLRDWRGRTTTVADLVELGLPEAARIYRDRYIDKPRLFVIKDDRLFRLAVDCSVLNGPAQSVRWLQEALDVDRDGILGPITQAALDTASPHRLALLICAYRWVHMGRLISSDHRQAIFAHGWSRRMAKFLHNEVKSASWAEGR